MTIMTKSARENGIAELSAAACRAVLKANHIGRIAFLSEGRVDIEPVSYAASGDWIFIRSATGTKMNALAHSPYVAFEVDEVPHMAKWRSVVARGTVYLMSDQGDRADREVFERALRALRSFLPETFRPGDPVPFRDTVYGIHIDRITGRAAAVPRRARSATARKPARRRRSVDGF